MGCCWLLRDRHHARQKKLYAYIPSFDHLSPIRVKKDVAVHWMYQCKLRSIILETLAGRDDESKNGKITNEEFHFSFLFLLFIKTIGSTHVSFYSKFKKMTGFHTNLRSSLLIRKLVKSKEPLNKIFARATFKRTSLV